MDRQERAIAVFLFTTVFLFSFSILINIGCWRMDDSLMFKFSRNLFQGKISKDYYIKGFFTPYLPFFLLFGLNRLSYRLAQSIFISMSAVLIYFLALNMYDKKVGLTTALLVLTNPLIVRFNAEAPLLLFFTSLIIYLLFKYRTKSDKRFLYMALLLAGYAISIKLLFIYVLAALFFAIVVLDKESLLNIKNKTLGISALALTVGCSLFIAANLVHGFPTLKYVAANFLRTEAGYNNFNLADNILIRLSQEIRLLKIPSRLYTLKSFVLNRVRFFVTVPLLGTSISLAFLQRRKKDLFLVIFPLFFLLFSTFLPTAPNINHLVPTIPSVFILIAILFRKLPRKISIPILIFLLSFNILTSSYVVYAINNERIVREKIPYLSDVHSEVKNFIGDEKYVITPFVWQATYLKNSYPNKTVEYLPQKNFYNQGKELKIGPAKKIIKQRLLDGSKTIFIFPSEKREGSEKFIYFWLCLKTEKERNLCSKPLSIFKKMKNELEIKCQEEDVVKDGFEKPVYIIYKKCHKT